jgi:Na+-transporting NADH:ubiquinone oxidoreductase subunit E
MEELINIFVKSVFVDNMVFAYFLGMCSYIAVSKTVKTSFWLGLAVIFVLLFTVPLNYLIYKYILQAGALTWISDSFANIDLTILNFILIIALIAGFVQLLEMFIEKISPNLYNTLGIFLPLIAVNCAIMGASLFMLENNFATVGQATVYSVGSGIGWLMAIVCLAAIREKLKYNNIPKPLQGLGIIFIITGLIGIAFMGFMGFKL